MSQLDVPQKPAHRPPGEISRKGGEQALTANGKLLPTRRGLALAQRKDHIRVVISKLQPTVNVQLSVHTSVAGDDPGQRPRPGGRSAMVPTAPVSGQ